MAANLTNDPKAIDWTTSAEDVKLISSVAQRAHREYLDLGVEPPDHQTLVMDLMATNANGCPMDFAKLLEAPRFDFCHDIGGIARHIDRTTGELGGCFVPRCAKQEGR